MVLDAILKVGYDLLDKVRRFFDIQPSVPLAVFCSSSTDAKAYVHFRVSSQTSSSAVPFGL